MSAQDKPVSDRAVWIGLAIVAAILLAVGGLVGRLLPQDVDQGDCVSSPAATVEVTDHGLVCQLKIG
jgi:hypothetical protein